MHIVTENILHINIAFLITEMKSWTIDELVEIKKLI